MKGVPRRGFITSAGSVFALVLGPFSKAPAAVQQPRHLGCIATLRLLNSLQKYAIQRHGAYRDLNEVMESEDLTHAIASTADDPEARKLGFSRERWHASGEFVPGYRLTFQEAPVGQYGAVMTEVMGANAYWTDQTGVIRVGTYSGAAEELALNGVGLSPPAPEQNGFVAAVLEFFVPTLHARRHECCTGACGGFCTSSCESCPPAICCNMGFESCTWCCRAIDFPYQCILGYCGTCQ